MAGNSETGPLKQLRADALEKETATEWLGMKLTLRLTGQYGNAYNWAMRTKTFLIVLGIFLVCLAASGFSQDDDEDLTSNVSFTVLKSDSGKPIRNAAVVVHPVNSHGKQERGGIELKTNEDGKASFEDVPYGKMRIQVLVPGFQTYGQDYEVKDPALAITIKMDRPKQQYSIYENTPADKSGNGQQKAPDTGAPPSKN